MKKTVAILILLGFLSPLLSSAQVNSPENMDEVKQLGEKALETTQKEMPGIIAKIWKEEVLPIWQKMWNWFLENIWPKIKSWFTKFIQPEIEKRKPGLEGEFQKEKQETKQSVKQDVAPALKSLWQKFKDLLK